MSIEIPSRLEPQHAEAKFLYDLGFSPKHPTTHLKLKHPNFTPADPLKKQIKHPHQPEVAPSKQPYFNAHDLTSFLSQIKYLNSESDAVDLGPLPTSQSSNLSTNDIIMKQSVRVRSQLELKFNCISLMAHSTPNLLNQQENTLKFNPLQTIRDRKTRPQSFKVPEKLLWHISVSEQVKDFSWRFKRARRRQPVKEEMQIKDDPKESEVDTSSRRSSRLTYTRSRSFSQNSSLAAGECGELIARLRKAHDEDPLVEDPIAIYDNERRSSSGSNKARFCLNNSQVTNTFNRMSKKSTGSEFSLEMEKKHPPTLLVTNDLGNETVLKSSDLISQMGGGDNLPEKHSRRKSDLSLKFKLPEDEFEPVTTNVPSSLRPSVLDTRRDPWERTMCTLEGELRFLIPFYKMALNRYDPQEQCSILVKRYFKVRNQETTAQLCDSVKLEKVPAYLRYLSTVEQEAVERQQRLDAEVASFVDGLRVSTDLMVSEVNTTLNRRIRSLTSRMERQCNMCECSFFKSAGYSAIEYALLTVMWVCWLVVKLWRLVTLRAFRVSGTSGASGAK